MQLAREVKTLHLKPTKVIYSENNHVYTTSNQKYHLLQLERLTQWKSNRGACKSKGTNTDRIAFQRKSKGAHQSLKI